MGFTPHPAKDIQGLHVCMGDEECGAQDGDRFIAPTDRDGCDINAYRMGVKNFYGPGSHFQVDTTKPFTVVTRFHAPSGDLEEIEQVYYQDDIAVDMNWLDSYMDCDPSAPGCTRGPCSPEDGVPET